MADLVAFPTGDGREVVVEVDHVPLAGTERAAFKPGEIVTRTTQTFDEAIDHIKPAAASVLAKLRDLPQPPSEVSVEFGVKLEVKAGAVIASTGGEGHFKVVVTWRKDQPTG